MNSWLASIYGTGGAQEADLEKTAQSMLLQKLAAQEGLSLEGMTPEQIDALAADVLGEQEGADEGQPVQQQGQPGMVAQAGEGASEEEVTEEGGEEEITKEAQEKFQEADFLGRVMAHAYTQELEKIAGAGDLARRAGNAIGGVGRRVGGAVGGAAKSVGGFAKDKGQKAYGAAKGHVQKHPKKYMGAAAAGGAAAAFGAGRASKSKEASASPILRKLAEMRAAEILTESGIDPATGKPLQQQGTPQAAAEPASPEAQVQEVVNDAAIELLKEAGYTFE